MFSLTTTRLSPLHCRQTPSTLATMFCLNVSLSMFSLATTRLKTPCIVATLHPRLSQCFVWTCHFQCSPLPPPDWNALFCRHTPSTLVTMSCLNVSLSMFTLTTRLKPPALSPHSIHACHNDLFERDTVNVLPYHHQDDTPCIVATLHPRLSQCLVWTCHCKCSSLPPPG